MLVFLVQTPYGIAIVRTSDRKELVEVSTEDEAYRYCYECDLYIAN